MGQGSIETTRARQMRAVLEEFERSGQTLQAFGQQRGIPVSTLTWWRHVWRGARKTRATKKMRWERRPARAFREVRVTPEAPAAERLEVVLAGGHVVRVPAGADRDTVRLVLNTLKAAC
jgi:hypothetical protein